MLDCCCWIILAAESRPVYNRVSSSLLFSFSFLFTYQLVFRHCHIVNCPVLRCLCPPRRQHSCPVRVRLRADTSVLSMSASVRTLLSCPCPPPRRHSCPVRVRLRADTPVLSVSAFAPTLLSCPCPPSHRHLCSSPSMPTPAPAPLFPSRASTHLVTLCHRPYRSPLRPASPVPLHLAPDPPRPPRTVTPPTIGQRHFL